MGGKGWGRKMLKRTKSEERNKNFEEEKCEPNRRFVRKTDWKKNDNSSIEKDCI